MKHRWSLVLIAACSGGSTDDDDPNPMVTPPKATALEVSECKGSCNQLKFFDCNDSVEQAGCYLNCENATSSQIELFNGCVQTDICDPTCSTHIKPANPPPVMSDPDDCSSACARLGADGCIPPESVAGCQGLCSSGTTSDRGTILYCESRRSGCMLPEECAPPMMDPVAECKDACDTLGFFSCINAQSQANCRNLCGTVADDVRDNFTACASAGSCNSDECYRLLDATGSADVEGCRQSCDDMSFFGCITASELSDCRTVCGSATPEDIESFKACTRGACQDNACYLELAG